MEIRVQSAPWYNGVELMIRDNNLIAVGIEMKEYESNTYIDPLLHLSREQAQTLLDDLWAAGYKPSDGSGSTGQLKATQAHLEDMRKLVFKNED